MSLSQRIEELIRAAFSGIWVQSHEHDDAVSEIAELARRRRWTLASWDIDRGFNLEVRRDMEQHLPTANDPLSAVKTLNGMSATEDDVTLLVLRNYHRFTGSAEVVQALETAIAQGKRNAEIVIVLSPLVQIPIELERQFVVVEHDLPGRERLEPIAR